MRVRTRDAFTRLFEWPMLPWLVAPVTILGFWVTEAWLHSTFLDGGPFVTGFLRPDAHETWMRALVVIVMLLVAALWSATLRQRAERMRELIEYQDRLRVLTSRLVSGEGEDRRDLSERLHEHVAQALTAARMFLASVDVTDEPSGQALRSAERILDRAIADCRDVAEELSPPSLDEYGLSPALRALADRISARTGTDVTLTGDDDVQLARPVLLTSFQVLSDVLESAVSDPRTSAIEVDVAHAGASVVVAVDWNAPEFGDMFSACERMSLVGGTFESAARDGRMRVRLIAPAA